MDNPFVEGLFYEKIDNKRVKCNLCPHKCIIDEDKSGICTVRMNVDGKLVTTNYGKVTAFHLDPIEKKPLYHFYPGSNILSIGTYGCNFKCSFCQNHTIAHDSPEYIVVSSEKIMEVLSQQGNSIGLAFTYNEPSIWYEFIEEIAMRAKEVDKKVVLVTNGYINEEPLRRILPLIDSMNIDLKAFTQEFYRDICRGSINGVMRTIEIASSECHVEVTTLLIEGLNAREDEIEALSKWLSSIDRGIPLHLSRYFPAYNMTLPATPLETMYKLKDVAMKHLEYVYLGNVGNADTNTYCPSCGIIIVERGNNTRTLNLHSGKCKRCNKKINLIL